MSAKTLTYRERLATQSCPLCRRPLAGRGVFQKADGRLFHYDCHKEKVVPSELAAAQRRLDAKPAADRTEAARREAAGRERGERLGMIRRWREKARAEVRAEVRSLSAWGRFLFLFLGRLGG